MRTLIVNADDLGIDAPRTRGILEAFQEGIVTCASIIPNMPHSCEAAQLAQEVGLPLGVHLNLSEGKPLSNSQNIETLVNERVEFLGKIPFRKALSKQHINPHHIVEEVRMQLTWFDENVGVPLHVDGHQHAHILGPIPTFLAPFLREFGVKSARIPQESAESTHDPLLTSDQKQLIQEVSMYAGYARLVFTCTGIESTPSFRGMTWMFDCTRARLWNILSSLPEGTTELMVHPGYCTERSVPFSSDTQRELELAFLIEPALQEFIQQQDITLSSH